MLNKSRGIFPVMDGPSLYYITLNPCFISISLYPVKGGNNTVVRCGFLKKRNVAFQSADKVGNVTLGSYGQSALEQ